MNLDGIPLFALIKGRLGYLGDRQKVIAANIANSDTPGFAPRDLAPFTSEFAKAVGGAAGLTLAPVQGAARTRGQAITDPRHIASNKPSVSAYKSKAMPDSEITLDGNGVVLEEQTMKLAEARLDYDAAIGFYQKSLGLLRMAARAPGR
jgi:flagellar basal-body rod protein FlgB